MFWGISRHWRGSAYHSIFFLMRVSHMYLQLLVFSDFRSAVLVKHHICLIGLMVFFCRQGILIDLSPKLTISTKKKLPIFLVGGFLSYCSHAYMIATTLSLILAPLSRLFSFFILFFTELKIWNFLSYLVVISGEYVT